MDRFNILNKQGMLTDEDRKEPYVRVESHSTFHSCVDLSCGVRIEPHGITKQLSVDQYSQDVASFIAYWTTFVMKDLNGFSDMSHVKFYLDGFELVDTNKEEEKSNKIQYLDINLSEHDDFKNYTRYEIEEQEIEEIFDVLFDDSTIELDGSLNKNDGTFLGNGVLEDDMIFMFKLSYDDIERYFKTTLSKTFTGEDRRWLSYMYYPNGFEEITKNEFIKNKVDNSFKK